MNQSVMLGYVRKLVRDLGLISYHTHDSRGSDPGFPDLTIVGRGVIYRELKPEQGDLSFHQRVWARRLRKAGESFAIWRPADWESGLIRRELEALTSPYKQETLDEAA